MGFAPMELDRVRRHRSLVLYGRHTLAHPEADEELAEICRLARLGTGADHAAITVLPQGHQVTVAADPPEDPALCVVGEDLSVCLTVLDRRAPGDLNRFVPMVVPDALADPDLRTHPFVTDPETRLRSYVGVPLVGHERVALGTLCVWSTRPGSIDVDRVTLLVELARATVNVLDDQRRRAG